ncbi:unnamed protein product [Cunninghamella echinulata]
MKVNVLTIVTPIYLLVLFFTLCHADMCYLPNDTCSLSKTQYINTCLKTCPESLCDTFTSFYIEKCIIKTFDNDEDIWNSIYLKSQKEQEEKNKIENNAS